MGEGTSVFGFVVIVILYATIGVMAAAGAVFLTQKFLKPKAEQIFYGAFLIFIAAFYLAFVAYFKSESALRVEIAAVFVFTLIGIFGTRLPIALIVGYPLHGLWDLMHEVAAHGGFVGFDPNYLSAIPLAYGVFCAAFDVAIAVYAQKRRGEWEAGWAGQAATPQP
jgi:hypothetical protein